MDAYQGDVVKLLSGIATVNTAVLPLMGVVVILLVGILVASIWK